MRQKTKYTWCFCFRCWNKFVALRLSFVSIFLHLLIFYNQATSMLPMSLPDTERPAPPWSLQQCYFHFCPCLLLLCATVCDITMSASQGAAIAMIWRYHSERCDMVKPYSSGVYPCIHVDSLASEILPPTQFSGSEWKFAALLTAMKKKKNLNSFSFQKQWITSFTKKNVLIKTVDSHFSE